MIIIIMRMRMRIRMTMTLIIKNFLIKYKNELLLV